MSSILMKPPVSKALVQMDHQRKKDNTEKAFLSVKAQRRIGEPFNSDSGKCRKLIPKFKDSSTMYIK